MKTKEDIVRNYLEEKRGLKFLEIGGGEFGYKYFGNFTKDYTGIDIVQPKENIPPVFIKQDLEKDEKLRFNDGTFDVIIALDVLEHLNNRHEIMRELKRVLKNEGIMIISLPNEFSYQPIWYHIKGINWMSGSEFGHKYMYDLKTAREYIEKHLKIEEEIFLYLDGKLEFLGGLNMLLARKFPRLFARNFLFKCKK